jgi:hypothetical protein
VIGSSAFSRRSGDAYMHPGEEGATAFFHIPFFHEMM